MVGLFLTPAALGLYVVGLALSNLPRFIGQAVGTVAFPQVASRPSLGAARRTMWRLVVLTVALSAAVVAVLEALAGRLVPLFFGNEFEGAVPLARILLLAGLFLSARRVLTDAARGAGYVSLGNLGEAVSWGVLVPAMAVLAPASGARGVALALAISAAASLVAMVATVALRPPPAEHAAEPATHLEDSVPVEGS